MKFSFRVDIDSPHALAGDDENFRERLVRGIGPELSTDTVLAVTSCGPLLSTVDCRRCGYSFASVDVFWAHLRGCRAGCRACPLDAGCYKLADHAPPCEPWSSVLKPARRGLNRVLQFLRLEPLLIVVFVFWLTSMAAWVRAAMELRGLAGK